MREVASQLRLWLLGNARLRPNAPFQFDSEGVALSFRAPPNFGINVLRVLVETLAYAFVKCLAVTGRFPFLRYLSLYVDDVRERCQ